MDMDKKNLIMFLLLVIIALLAIIAWNIASPPPQDIKRIEHYYPQPYEV